MSKPIRIAVASGKGGTGKTTIATNLAHVLAKAGMHVGYIDCDVEEPNGHLFLNPTIQERKKVLIPVPEVDEASCDLCGACGKACRYSAILVLPQKVLTFPKLCHGCGGCTLSCPKNAIKEIPKATGVVEIGISDHVFFVHGKLDVGEAMAPPAIRAVLGSAPTDRIIIIDSPPGTSCPVIESVKTADVVLLVTEPTPFGLNDLVLAVEMVRELGLPFGVVANRVGAGNDDLFDYCSKEEIPILARLPNDREIAHAYSRGVLPVVALPRLEPVFADLYGKLEGLVEKHPKRTFSIPPMPESISEAREPFPSEVRAQEDKKLFELVVISGKGGTGKTSIVASLFACASKAAVADCDVDAADLHLVLDPTVRQRWTFSGGQEAYIETEKCIGCGLCVTYCRFDAIRTDEESGVYTVDHVSCEGCGVCEDICPHEAVKMIQTVNGEWFISDTRHGPMTHARLGIASENSGKLVSLVRREGKVYSLSNGRGLLICDGSPGIGCPVIASVAGADMVLVVTEPTLSGLHDLKRVAELCRQFRIKTGVCINKTDINPEISDDIEREAKALDLSVLGRIRYDDSVTTAQVKKMSVVEHGEGPANEDIRMLWERLIREIG